jgi:DNA-directed RNA polymerase specialized sigma24 family protein
VTTLLRNLKNVQQELVEAAVLIGLSWPEIAELIGKPSGNAARVAHDRWKAGR